MAESDKTPLEERKELVSEQKRLFRDSGASSPMLTISDTNFSITRDSSVMSMTIEAMCAYNARLYPMLGEGTLKERIESWRWGSDIANLQRVMQGGTGEIVTYRGGYLQELALKTVSAINKNASAIGRFFGVT